MLDFLANRWNDLIDFLYRLLLTWVEFQKDILLWILDQLMTVAVAIVDGMGHLFAGLDVAQYWSLIPPETAYFLNLIGLSQAVGMIITCLGIRFILQMIPLVRWGS